MNRVFFPLFLIGLLLLVGCGSYNSIESGDSTEIETKSTDTIVQVDSSIGYCPIEQLIDDCDIIVHGQVVEILGTVESKDLHSPRPPEMMYLHTDILISVHEYLGPVELDYNYIVIRRLGGRLGDHVHLTSFEHFTVGEEVVLFLRYDEDHELMTQIPEGYEHNQYFLYEPIAKYVRRGSVWAREGFPEKEDLDMATMRETIQERTRDRN